MQSVQEPAQYVLFPISLNEGVTSNVLNGYERQATHVSDGNLRCRYISYDLKNCDASLRVMNRLLNYINDVLCNGKYQISNPLSFDKLSG